MASTGARRPRSARTDKITETNQTIIMIVIMKMILILLIIVLIMIMIVMMIIMIQMLITMMIISSGPGARGGRVPRAPEAAGGEQSVAVGPERAALSAICSIISNILYYIGCYIVVFH